MKTNFLKSFFILPALFLLVSFSIAHAEEDDGLVAGRDYIVIDPPLPTRSGDDIEVLEFFNFSCPHCFRFQGVLNQWQDQNDLSDVQLIHQPVVFQRYNGHFARVFHTIEAMQLVDEYYGKVFEAIHSDKKLINSKGRFFDWLEDNGIDEEKAAAIYDSFSVNAKIKRDAIIAQEYGISSTPQIAVAGKYVLTPGQSASQSDMMRVVSLLIERERSAIKKEE